MIVIYSINEDKHDDMVAGYMLSQFNSEMNSFRDSIASSMQRGRGVRVLYFVGCWIALISIFSIGCGFLDSFYLSLTQLDPNNIMLKF